MPIKRVGRFEFRHALNHGCFIRTVKNYVSQRSTRFYTPGRALTAGLLLSVCLGISVAEATGSLYVARNFPQRFTHGEQRVTLLPDGTIFKYSDCWAFAEICSADAPATGEYAEVSLWNPGTRQWDSESVAVYMNDFTSTLTHDGRIVMVGGWVEFNNHSIATTAIYNSKGQTFRAGPTLDEARHRHTATELSDGGVLVVGGEAAPELTTAGVELITAGGGHKTLRPMLQDRADHTATRLPSGNILVVGGARYLQPDALQKSLSPGRHPKLSIVDTVELYDVAKDRWSALPPLPGPRMRHSATLLPDGRVMIIGGSGGDGQNTPSVAASVLLWNPATGQWSAAHDLPRGREGHIATLLPSGDVLVSGGWDERFVRIQDFLLWDHATGQWSNAGRAHDRMQLFAHTAELLPNGNVLLVPTSGEMAVWSPRPERDPSGNWVSPREGATITRLSDGRFLMVGGESAGNALFYAHIYDPATQRWSDTAQMHYPRVHHRATRLADGRVLVLGGSAVSDPHHPYASQPVPAEIWDPATGKWMLFPALALKAEGHCEPKFLKEIRQRVDRQGRDCGDDAPTELRGLSDGRVLLGVELPSDADAPKEYSYRTWTPGDRPPTQAERIESPRSGGCLILLDDGNLVYVGGRYASGQPSAELDIFGLDSKRWRPAGTLHQPIASPGILDLGDRRLLIFERSSGAAVSTADLWRESGYTQVITLPPDMVVSHARGERPDDNQPFSVRAQYASQTVRPDSWRAIGLSSGKILLLTEERSYVAEPPYESWETIHNEVRLRTVSSPVASLQNDNALVFTGTPLPLHGGVCADPACTNYAFTFGYWGQYQVSEFDPGRKQWHAIPTPADREQTPRERAGPASWPANLTRSDGPFYFLVALHPHAALKVRDSFRRELFSMIGLLMCLVIALIYWKKRAADRAAPARSA
jgi:hypothetical protein